MNDQPHLNLIYGNMRALCEAPQMMMRYANVEYSYNMVWDFYKKPWKEIKNKINFNRIPILIIDNKEYIWQSNSIIRYLSKLTNTLPEDPFLSAYADSIFESTHEMFVPLNPTVNIYIGDNFLSNKENLLSNILPKALKNFELIMRKFEGDFFLGSRAFYCDFNAYHYFALALLLDKNILNSYPLLLNFMKSFPKLKNIKDYLINRPKLIDIGIAPKFIIDNESYPTGINPYKKY